MNPWHQAQKRVELPAVRKLIPLDDQDIQTLDQFLNEPKVEIYFEPNDDTDYAVWNADGSVTRVSATPTINGIRWQLVPGKNLIPKSIYEFLMQCPEQRHRVASPMMNQCLDF